MKCQKGGTEAPYSRKAGGVGVWKEAGLNAGIVCETLGPTLAPQNKDDGVREIVQQGGYLPHR